MVFPRVNRPGTAGIDSTAASMIVFGAGFGLISARSFLPGLMSFPLANGLICGGYLLTLRGYCRFSGRKFRDAHALAVLALYVVEFSYYYYVENIYLIILFFYLVTYGVVAIVLVYQTISDYRSTGHRSHLVAFAFAGFIGSLLLGTGAMSVGYTAAADILSLTTINAAVMLGRIFFVVG